MKRLREIAAPPSSFSEESAKSGILPASPVQIKNSATNTERTGPFRSIAGENFTLGDNSATPSDQNTKSQPTLWVRTSPMKSFSSFGYRIATSAIIKNP